MSEKLVVASKVKSFLKKNAGLSCSATVMAELSKVVEQELVRAAENAKRNKRKTVLDRDFRSENF